MKDIDFKFIENRKQKIKGELKFAYTRETE